MKISYKKLWILLIEKEISPAKLRKDLSIADFPCKAAKGFVYRNRHHDQAAPQRGSGTVGALAYMRLFGL